MESRDGYPHAPRTARTVAAGVLLIAAGAAGACGAAALFISLIFSPEPSEAGNLLMYYCVALLIACPLVAREVLRPAPRAPIPAASERVLALSRPGEARARARDRPERGDELSRLKQRFERT